MQKKIRVLIVDDSLLIRTMFTQMLSQYSDIEVVGAAVDPFDAREKIKALNPDVVTLDVEMPKMDGITFLEKIMTLRPMPVIMVSTLTARGADITIRALEIGAVDFITKPTVTNDDELLAIGRQLAEKIRQASVSRLVGAATTVRKAEEKLLEFRGITRMRMIAIGASTGGVEALREVLHRVPNTLPEKSTKCSISNRYYRATFTSHREIFISRWNRCRMGSARVLPMVKRFPAINHQSIFYSHLSRSMWAKIRSGSFSLVWDAMAHRGC